MPSSLRILVIDDDPVMRELLDALLGYAGHHVTVVDSGIAALHLLESHAQHFDVVLSDLHMPVLQGKELAGRLLASREANTLLVGMSGSSPTEDETHLLDEFLQKPFSTEQFAEAVERAKAHAAAKHVPNASPTASEPILDESVFTRMAATLSADQLRGIYNLTLDDVTDRLVQIQAAVTAGDNDTVHREAHAIKGGTGMVGARQLYALAAALEATKCTDSFPLENFTLACDRLKRILDERLTPK